MCMRILTGHQLFNSRHESDNRWKAHEHLILASFVSSYHDRDVYVTGGNDGSIAIWDISGCVKRPKKGLDIGNGKPVIRTMLGGRELTVVRRATFAILGKACVIPNSIFKTRVRSRLPAGGVLFEELVQGTWRRN